MTKSTALKKLALDDPSGLSGDVVIDDVSYGTVTADSDGNPMLQIVLKNGTSFNVPATEGNIEHLGTHKIAINKAPLIADSKNLAPLASVPHLVAGSVAKKLAAKRAQKDLAAEKKAAKEKKDEPK